MASMHHCPAWPRQILIKAVTIALDHPPHLSLLPHIPRCGSAYRKGSLLSLKICQRSLIRRWTRSCRRR